MKQALRSLHLTACMLMLAVLTACASMAQPDTFNKKAAAAYVTVQTVAESANAAYKAGKLSKDDAANVVATTRATVQAIDVANVIYQSNAKAGEDKLAAALAVLTALQAYLATQGVN